MSKPVPLYDVQNDISDLDVDLALPYPRKNFVVSIAIGGVTDRTGTPNLGDKAMIADGASMLYVKQVFSHMEVEGLHVKADVMNMKLHKDEHEARAKFDKEIKQYHDTVYMIVGLTAETWMIEAEIAKLMQSGSS
mmetsp:Transcript_19499/g.14185  ORF Transcript_19499/g.14185 Transcript_19499/m.14185 type:complete len:135 (+) Transcript_19499:1708-2112(+)